MIRPFGLVFGLCAVVAVVALGCADSSGKGSTCAIDCGVGFTCEDGRCVSIGGTEDSTSVLDLGGDTSGLTDTQGIDTQGTDTGNSGELCNNGVDDNRDGVIDEGCSCTPNTTQACWPNSTLRRRNVGACRDGLQACIQLGDFWIWGRCEGAILPATEIPGNGIDEDCDGADAEGSCWGTEKGDACMNGLDDDCDGDPDCLDADCATFCASCTEHEEVCTGGIDEDCDGLTDCADPDCANVSGCDNPQPTGCQPAFPFFLEISCGDGVDNDCDTRIDCDDPDCKKPGSCGCASRETACSDQVDNDCDGHTDCGDENCETCAPGSERWCDDPTQCYWGLQSCGNDGTWGDCYETDQRPGSCSGDLYSASCCVSAGGCCQNYPNDQSSIGNCATISHCNP